MGSASQNLAFALALVGSETKNLPANEGEGNVGDLGSIPGSGRSPGGRYGNPLQYSWASLVVQMVKNMPAMWETWVQSLGREDPLEEGMATHSSILAWRIPTDSGAWWAHGVTKSDATKWLTHTHTLFLKTWSRGTFLVVQGLVKTPSFQCRARGFDPWSGS